MRIHSLSKVLAMPIVLVTVGIAFYQYSNGDDIGWWIIVPIIALVILYMSYGYIDYWYHTKYPIPLDPKIVSWLKQYSSFYQLLPPSDKEKFEYRMSLYLEGRSFKSVGSEQKELPEDIKAIIASCGVQMNFYREDILIGDFDRIFIYKHPFPSPQFQFLHSVETQIEDGVMIFSLEHLIPGIIKPDQYYNICMHGYVEAFTKAYPDEDYPWELGAGWEDVEKITEFRKDQILSTLGFDSADLFVVLATCYFTYPDRFRSALPALYSKMNALFRKEIS